MWQRLRNDRGMVVSRETVRHALRIIDPEGVSERLRNRLRRRQYWLMKFFTKTIDVITEYNVAISSSWYKSRTLDSCCALNNIRQKILQSTNKLLHCSFLHKKVLNLLTFLTLWPFAAKSLNWAWNIAPGSWSPEEVLSLSLSLTEVLKYQQMIHEYKRNYNFLKFW